MVLPRIAPYELRDAHAAQIWHVRVVTTIDIVDRPCMDNKPHVTFIIHMLML